MQFGQGKPPVGIIYDSDLGNRIDGALALALLYGFDGKNECRVVSVSVTKSSLHAAAFAEIIGRFYAGTVSGAFGSFVRTLPVGVAMHGYSPQDTPFLKAVLERKNADGTPVYPHGIQKLTDTAEPVALVRNAFTAQYDQNAIAVLNGPPTTLAKVLELPPSKDLISRKVRFLVLLTSELKHDIPAARKLLAEWPTPIFAAGPEIGEELRYPASSIEKDFGYSQAHPVVDAYRAAGQMPYDAATRDMTAVLYAARPQDKLFLESEPGTLSIAGDGSVRFTPSPDGKHKQLKLDPAQKEKILKLYVEVASAKPVPRMPRFRSQQQQQQQKQAPEAKPAAKPETKP